jgi:uncharacterized protein (TIGR02391 family)
MQPLATALRRLEHLNALVTEYSPIKFESSERSRELARLIPGAYGAVEEVYRHYAGDQEVLLNEGRHKKTFRNYFEAGWLSGRTFHTTEGRRELEKVIGRVRAALEDGASSGDAGDPVHHAWRLLHPRVQVVAQNRFQAGHYADAVEATLKELAGVVRALVLQRGGPELDGVALMQKAFSPNGPIVVLADLGTQSGKDMQRGYMEMFAGAMAAIRNPKAHGNIVITAERAMHFLFVASTLWYTLDERP